MNEKLEPLGIIDNEEDYKIGRRIEWMSGKQLFSVISLFAFCNISIILCVIFGPQHFITQSTYFNTTEDALTPLRFTFDFAGFHNFNDFLILDVIFNRSSANSISNMYNFSYVCHSTMSSGNKIFQLGSPNEKNATAIFPNPSTNISNPVRLIAKGSTDFSNLHSLIIFKNTQRALLPGKFEWSYANPSIAIVNTYLRLVFFIISLLVFIRLLCSDFTFANSNIFMKLMFLVDIVFVFACNPFHFLSFFSDSPLFPLYDTMMASFLVSNAFYVALVVLLMKNVANRDVSKCWLLSVYVFFLAAFCIFVSKSVITVLEVRKNPLSKKTDAIKGLGYTKIGIAALYLIVLIYAMLTFKSDVPNERPMYSFMAMILFITITVSEFFGIENPYAGTDTSMETFSLLAVGTYILFFNFINWPSSVLDSADPEAAEPKIQSEDKQIIVDNE